jgi:3-oxoacyl-[acyl-carrier-protein] synthase-3
VRLFLHGVSAVAQRLQSVEEAVATGDCDERLARSTGMRSVAVATLAGPELAARAGRLALHRAGAGPADGGDTLVLHASAYYQGVDMWSPASYVQRETVGGTGPAIQVGQVSNGGLAALELARCHLAVHGGRALVTTGDRFGGPGFHRWRTDPGTVYGDAGTAVLVSPEPGPVRLRSVALTGDPELEEWHRAGHPFGRAQLDVEPVNDLAARQKQFLAAIGREEAAARVAAGRGRAVDAALREAGAGRDELSFFVLPHMGAARLARNYYEPMSIDPGRTAWDRAREVGHLGAGDVFCGLEHVLGQGRTGVLGLLLGVGAGFSWGAAVVELT